MSATVSRYFPSPGPRVVPARWGGGLSCQITVRDHAYDFTKEPHKRTREVKRGRQIPALLREYALRAALTRGPGGGENQADESPRPRRVLVQSNVTILFLSVGVLLVAARILGEIAKRLRQPVVLGEILAGILLGPTLLT